MYSVVTVVDVSMCLSLSEKPRFSQKMLDVSWQERRPSECQYELKKKWKSKG